MKHKNKYSIYTLDIELVNFLRGDGKYNNRPLNEIDKQIYSHFGQNRQYTDKYIGIIIEFQSKFYFAPLTHDGNKSWYKRQKTCDFEMIYDAFDKYAGSLLLCKALPLTSQLVKYHSLKDIARTEGQQYSKLCEAELDYLNSSDIHDVIQTKMLDCIYGKESLYKKFRVNYQLVEKNVKEYNEMLKQQELLINKPHNNESGNGSSKVLS
ncbi:MAG: type III toxin-antitoxin system ToxN/AbiQ family toxin [Mycoplasmataceae bacterium]|jgi:hypothetical protein|nr:type III toxin-antitoxin system ToxN/AbiQ family toxin [Mycoplasmataceae bacterium]